MSNPVMPNLGLCPPAAVLALFAVSAACPAFAGPGDAESPEELYFEEVPVVLSATRLSQSAADSPASITVIDRAMIEASGALRVVDLFRLIPGMQVGYVSGARFSVSEHGMADRYARRLQVLVDNRPVYDPGYGGVSWFNLPIAIDNIERIEAIRGPNASTYGSNAFSGVINIITRHPATDRGTRLRGTLGEWDTGIATLSHSGFADSLDYRVTLNHQEDSGFENRHDSSSQDWLNIRGDWQIAHDQKLLVEFGISDGYRHEGFPDDLVNPRRKNGQHYNYQQLRWSTQPGLAEEYVVQFYHNHLEIDDSFVIPVEIPGLPMPISAGWGFESDRYDLEFQATQALSRQLRFVWGAGARHDQARSIWAFNTTDTMKRDQGRLFLNAEWHPTEKLVGNLGFMAEFQDDIHPLYSPRLGLNYHLDGSNTLRVSGSQAYRLPSLFEENADQMAFMGEELLPFNRWFYSFGGMEPERIRSLELGYVGRFDGPGITLDARLFREKISSMITHVYDYSIPDPVPIPGLEEGTERAMNGGEVEIQGLEVGFRYAPTPAGFLYAGYSYLDADGEQLRIDPVPPDGDYKGKIYRNLDRQVPEHLFSLLGSYRFDNGLRLSSGLYYSDAVVWAGDGDAVPDYHRWDVKVDRDFALDKATLRLALIYRHVDADQIDFYNQPKDQRINVWDDALFVEATLHLR